LSLSEGTSFRTERLRRKEGCSEIDLWEVEDKLSTAEEKELTGVLEERRGPTGELVKEKRSEECLNLAWLIPLKFTVAEVLN